MLETKGVDVICTLTEIFVMVLTNHIIHGKCVISLAIVITRTQLDFDTLTACAGPIDQLFLYVFVLILGFS